ncbi:uncharacterized protein LOC113388059 [Ctenocephalides felis]|uniref:uncharacterized protein LOC113388059 n=1 Tax=Ctenocephalides felis TaxID=7515 RepID=UPI000E6E506D|nr:uncharacterized protein LOC113388059 [Ctenocephalides felis]
MGNRLSLIWGKLFEFPVKRKPICFFRQEDFTSSGEYIGDIKSEPAPDLQGKGGNYERMLNAFYAELLRLRNLRSEEVDCYCDDDVSQKFPGWDGTTVANLHSLYLLFDKGLNNMLNLEDFEAILDSLGDESLSEYRNEKFKLADSDGDGWITRQEFLELIYYFNEPKDENEQLGTLAKHCKEVAERILFVGSLTLGEQLEYGLF